MKRSTRVTRIEKKLAKLSLKAVVKTRAIRDLDKTIAKLHAKRTKLEEERREIHFDITDIEDKEAAGKLEFARRFIEDGNESHPGALHGMSVTTRSEEKAS